jgi:putative NADH-flavin reductase
MKEMMQSLSMEDRTALKEQLGTMSQEDRSSMLEQMKQVDKSSMSSEDYAQTLLDILDQTASEDSTTGDILSVYA